ncbi:MAG: type IX secretion system membrane protein PorP/SprF [Balneolaceae bacterium]|nr:type IX secretion system membrane protein PorP/SprF [Balneolaceae bacterium]
MLREAYIPILIFAFLIMVQPAMAQNDSEGSSGSVYSKIGLGAPVDPANSSAYGMGLFGVSYIEPQVPSLGNPAHWGLTQYGIASGGFELRTTHASDGNDQTSNTRLSATDFQLQVPLWQGTWGASLSFYPSTQSMYRMVRDGQRVIGTGASADTVGYTTDSSGSGGINNIELGFGWSPNQNLAVGYAAKLVVASIDNQFLTTFDDEGYQTVDFTLQTSGTAISHRFGLYLQFPGLLGDDDLLSLGATADLPATINATRNEEDNELQEGSFLRGSSAVGEAEISTPLSLSGGITYRVNLLTSFTVEGMYQNWGDATYAYNAGDEAMYSNRVKVGAGLRYHPFANGTTNVLSIFKYRLGVSYDTGHLSINGKDITTLKFSGGIGIPSSRTGSTIDLGMYYGFRGSQSQNLVKENVWGLRLTLNLAELMFTRSRLQ